MPQFPQVASLTKCREDLTGKVRDEKRLWRVTKHRTQIGSLSFL